MVVCSRFRIGVRSCWDRKDIHSGHLDVSTEAVERQIENRDRIRQARRKFGAPRCALRGVKLQTLEIKSPPQYPGSGMLAGIAFDTGAAMGLGATLCPRPMLPPLGTIRLSQTTVSPR